VKLSPVASVRPFCRAFGVVEPLIQQTQAAPPLASTCSRETD
jgi:hypothetical protein